MDQVIVSDTNRTPVVQIVTWLTLVTSVLAFLTHAGIKFYASRSLGVETTLVFLSLVFCTAQSISVSVEAGNGFGTPINTLSDGKIQAMLKSGYAATIFFFCSIAFSKFAIIAFIYALTPKRIDRYINYGLGIYSLLWLIVCIFVTLFQCPLPHPWNKPQGGCINISSWWNAATIMNMAGEIGLVGLEIGVVAPLHIALERKVSIITLFACRLFVAAAAAVQLYFFHKDGRGPRKDDFALGYWRSATANQVVQCLAIVTTTLPYAKLFMESFESGMIRVDKVRLKESQSEDVSGRGYELLDFSHSSDRSKQGIKRTKSFTVESTPTSQIRNEPPQEPGALKLRADLA